MPLDPATTLLPGPWRHREVGAHGHKFHVAEAGTGPLVLLLHGFPQFWWCWRHQLTALADAGFHVAALDLRGYGSTDKPPRGYDVPNLAADVAAVIRALGESDAVVVGHDWGAVLGWTLGTLRPQLVRKLVILGTAHPLSVRRAFLHGGAQLRASGYMFAFQTPWRPERHLVADDGAYVGELLRAWSGPGLAPDAATEEIYRRAMQVSGVPHSALEYYRWTLRSQLRPDGAAYARSLAPGVPVPVLQVHGSADACMLLATTARDGRHVEAAYRLEVLDGVGHFVMEEAPAETSRLIAEFAA